MYVSSYSLFNTIRAQPEPAGHAHLLHFVVHFFPCIFRFEMPEIAPITVRTEPDITDAELTPRQIVAELDKYIVGQDDAKKSVAIALRNRWRRLNAPEDMRDEIMPNNIIMIGPTGVGENGNSAPPCPPGRCSVHQSGSDKVHRGGLRGPRRGVYDP